MSFGIFYLVSQSDAGLQGVQNKQNVFIDHMHLFYHFLPTLDDYLRDFEIINKI